MKEATSSPYNKLVFREVFSDESSVKKNGGSPTDVTFSNGVGSFGTGNLNYKLNLNGTFSLRLRLKPNDVSGTSYLFADAVAPTTYRVYVSGGTLYATSSTKYINGVVSTSLSDDVWQEIVIAGVTLSSLSQWVGSYSSTQNKFDGDIDLFEIYQGTLTASEVANLYNNTWNTELSGIGGQVGANVITNTDFTDSNWIPSGTISNITANGFTSSGNGGMRIVDAGLVVGKKYRIIFTGTTTATDCQLYNNTGGSLDNPITGAFISSIDFIAVATGLYVRNNGSGATTVTILSARELTPKLLLDFDSTNGVLEDKTVGNTVGSDKINLNLTSGWSNSMGGEFLDTNSFTTVTSGAVQKTTNVLVSGKKYRCLIKGNFTGEVGNFRISDNGGTVYQYITENDFNYVFEFTHSSIATRIQLQSADSKVRTVNLDYFLLYEIRPDLSATAVTVNKNGALFNGSTSLIDTGTDMIGTKAITFMGWIKPYSYGEGTYGRIIDNGKFIFNTYSGDEKYYFTSNASATYSANNSVKLNTWQFVAVTRESDGTANFYIGDKSTAPALSGSANQDSGTPAAGSTNLIIGNNDGATRTFDGIIAKIKVVEGILSQNDITREWSSSRSETQ